MKRFLTPKNAISYLLNCGVMVTRSTLSRWRKEEQGPSYVKYGRHIYYERKELDRFVKLTLQDEVKCCINKNKRPKEIIAREREQHVCELRALGYSFSAIAKELDISTSAASRMYRKVSDEKKEMRCDPVIKEILDTNEETEAAKTRAVKIYRGLRYRFTNEEIAAMGKNGIVKERKSGRKTAFIICKALMNRGYSPSSY